MAFLDHSCSWPSLVWDVKLSSPVEHVTVVQFAFGQGNTVKTSGTTFEGLDELLSVLLKVLVCRMQRFLQRHVWWIFFVGIVGLVLDIEWSFSLRAGDRFWCNKGVHFGRWCSLYWWWCREQLFQPFFNKQILVLNVLDVDFAAMTGRRRIRRRSRGAR